MSDYDEQPNILSYCCCGLEQGSLNREVWRGGRGLGCSQWQEEVGNDSVVLMARNDRDRDRDRDCVA